MHLNQFKELSLSEKVRRIQKSFLAPTGAHHHVGDGLLALIIFFCQTVTLMLPFHFQEFNSHDVRSDNLALDQRTIPLVIFCFILITTLDVIVLAS